MAGGMTALEIYVQKLAERRTQSVEETTHYGLLETLLNNAAEGLRPKRIAIVHPKATGAGLPDLGIFEQAQFRTNARPNLQHDKPFYGVVEAKPTSADLDDIARSAQVRRYAEHYGLVLVTNLFQFRVVSFDGALRLEERFDLAATESEFWAAARQPKTLAASYETALYAYLRRFLIRGARFSRPQDVAQMLASYARHALAQVEAAGEVEELHQVRADLEKMLGMTFQGDEADRFFQSTLVQTLFYVMFSTWALWSAQDPPPAGNFSRYESLGEVSLPRILHDLFWHMAAPQRLEELGISEALKWAEAALNRVDRDRFFEVFQNDNAIQYFYEPFLREFDPRLREELGVWYTPPEIVQYMVGRVEQVLERELGITEGLLNEQVIVLDPCCGTGAFLVEVLRRIYQRALNESGSPRDAAAAALRAARERLNGFEILPAPFVVAHLQIGFLLTRWQAALGKRERARVYLTNTLTGWERESADQSYGSFLTSLEDERTGAQNVKTSARVLVVIGNPPYNAFAGISPAEEGGLVEIYKSGLRSEWGIRKYNLDDLYIRFFRIAERYVTEDSANQRGVVCYISNFSYLDGASFVTMRQRFVQEFDALWFDNLNGDSRETGKVIPSGLPNAGQPDPSAFSTPFNREGIRVGTAVSLLVRRGPERAKAVVRYRDFWGIDKREKLLASLSADDFDSRYELAVPDRSNRYAFRPSAVSASYQAWPRLTELAAQPPMNGLMEKRGGALIDLDREALARRMQRYLDRANVSWEQLQAENHGLTKDASGYYPLGARMGLKNTDTYSDSLLVKYAFHPFDTRWCYYIAKNAIWNRPRPELWKHVQMGTDFIISRPASVVSDEGKPIIYTRILGDNDYQRGHSYYIPFHSVKTTAENGVNSYLQSSIIRTANLSPVARAYLADLELPDPDVDDETAALLWRHALAIGYSPAYLSEHADGIRTDYPRIPLPASAGMLRQSATLGAQVAALLDTESPVPTVTSGMIRTDIRGIGELRTSGAAFDLRLAANWGYISGGAVMPGRGRIEPDPPTPGDRLRVYLNDSTWWDNVPLPVWDYTIGGYQVLKKWLSYRAERILERPLTNDEEREFRDIVRRLAALVALETELDANYQAVAAEAVGLPSA